MVSGFFSYSVRRWVYLSQYVRQLRGHSTSVVVFHLHTILSLRRIRRFVDALQQALALSLCELRMRYIQN